MQYRQALTELGFPCIIARSKRGAAWLERVFLLAGIEHRPPAVRIGGGAGFGAFIVGGRDLFEISSSVMPSSGAGPA